MQAKQKPENSQAHHISNVGGKEVHQFVPCSDRFLRSVQGTFTLLHAFPLHSGEKNSGSLHDQEMEREGKGRPEISQIRRSGTRLNVQRKYLHFPRSLRAGGLESTNRTLGCLYPNWRPIVLSGGTHGHLSGPHSPLRTDSCQIFISLPIITKALETLRQQWVYDCFPELAHFESYNIYPTCDYLLLRDVQQIHTQVCRHLQLYGQFEPLDQIGNHLLRLAIENHTHNCGY